MNGDTIDTRLKMLEYRTHNFEENFRRIDENFIRINEKIDRMDERYTDQFLRIEERFATVEEKFTDVHKHIALQTRWLLGGLFGTAAFISIMLPVVMRLTEIYLK